MDHTQVGADRHVQIVVALHDAGDLRTGESAQRRNGQRQWVDLHEFRAKDRRDLPAGSLGCGADRR